MAEDSFEFSPDQVSGTSTDINYEQSSLCTDYLDFDIFQGEQCDYCQNIPQYFQEVLPMIEDLMQYSQDSIISYIRRQDRFCPCLGICQNQLLDIDEKTMDNFKLLLILIYVYSIAQFRYEKSKTKQFVQLMQQVVNEMVQSPRQFYLFINQIESLIEKLKDENCQQNIAGKIQILQYVYIMVNGIVNCLTQNQVVINLGYLCGLIQNLLLKECKYYCNGHYDNLPVQKLCLSILFVINKIDPKYQLSIQQEQIYLNLSEVQKSNIYQDGQLNLALDCLSFICQINDKNSIRQSIQILYQRNINLKQVKKGALREKIMLRQLFNYYRSFAYVSCYKFYLDLRFLSEINMLVNLFLTVKIKNLIKYYNKRQSFLKELDIIELQLNFFNFQRQFHFFFQMNVLLQDQQKRPYITSFFYISQLCMMLECYGFLLSPNFYSFFVMLYSLIIGGNKNIILFIIDILANIFVPLTYYYLQDNYVMLNFLTFFPYPPIDNLYYQLANVCLVFFLYILFRSIGYYIIVKNGLTLGTAQMMQAFMRQM